MPRPEFYTAAVETSDWISAVVAVAVAFAIAEVVDRALSRRGRRLSAAVAGGELSPVATTRLRLVRRLIFVLIILIGLAVAVSFLDPVRQLATGLLASSAALGIVVGFAARQTLANAIAGIMLAIAQPIRIGDLVRFEEETGEVKDMQLTYTYIRVENGRRLIVPNERLAASPIENLTVVDARVQVEVSVWLSPDADFDRALELVTEDRPDVSATVAEVDKEGVRLTATTWAGTARERGRVAAELRQRWLRPLREHGLSSVEAS
jgi:small-conductance mechanosensitive channel